MVPFIWWFVTARKHQKFSQWIGLKKIDGGKKALAAIAVLLVAFLLPIFIKIDIDISMRK